MKQISNLLRLVELSISEYFCAALNEALERQKVKGRKGKRKREERLRR